ncbi:MAG: hypothetical protein AVDCRST_MAG34-1816 [uncultured Nocardioidaceae bacterium]|uniref:Uncharacterized protein n=1 Tax=uncultured Nocardioidaceae bacterium TaxID=253824 RepID=A0A6J4M9D8_9ACTN|nr:MAG: hypothetical protein AVDCRST_MAG34-1816 [uncultured Nocardioidaceae bacterium]
MVNDMVFEFPEREQRDRAVARLREQGLQPAIPPQPPTDVFPMRVANVPAEKRADIETAVRKVAPDTKMRH